MEMGGYTFHKFSFLCLSDLGMEEQNTQPKYRMEILQAS